MSTPSRALLRWQACLGSAGVLDGRQRGQDTSSIGAEPLVVLLPASIAEVQECLRIAGECGISLHPISRGRNWSYGSKVPTCEGAVVVDLGRMKRILDFDEDLAHVTVEPGVTQQQLYDFLRVRGSNLMMSVTGSSPDSSLIGNTVERGLAVGPLGDRFGNSCNFEVVLPTGHVVQTGYGRYPGARTGELLRHAVGPAFEGLFTQSNFGIVTRMTMWLQPRPPYFQAVAATIRDREHLAIVVDEMRALSQLGLLKGSFGFWNDYKMLAALRQYPFDLTESTPLPDFLRRRMTRRAGMGPWILVGALYSGSRRHGLAERELVEERLRGHVDRLVFVDELRAGVAKFISPFVEALTGEDLAANIDRLYGESAFLGIPSSFPLRQLYWRRRGRIPDQPTPDSDGCGAIACSPTVPFRGRDVQ
ncbi:MAG: FAD-dependent oxidoreductase, partial [Myxococcales bacterium]|nr:FAD-dependent oxidoreductase [Myxococcales bacterium]